MKRILALSLLLAFVGLARAQTPADMETAKKEFDAGQVAYNLAKYDEALKRYTHAYELAKLPALLFNLGQAYRRLYETAGGLDNLRHAREMYRSYLRLVPFSAERPTAEQLLKEVEAEYAKQLHAQRDKLLIDARGLNALNLAEDFAGQEDWDAAQAALERFVKAPGNLRADVARGLRVRARVQAGRGDESGAVDTFSRALALDPATAPPPDLEKIAISAFGNAAARMKGKPPLKLSHVPPNRLKIGATPRLRIEVANDGLGQVRGLVVTYRAGGSAYVTLDTKPGEVTFPATFAAGLAPGTRIDYYITAVDAEGAALDSLGSTAQPFTLHVDAKPPVPVYKKWQFWVGMGAAAIVAAGAAAAIGVTQSPPERVAIPVNSSLGVR